MKNNNTSIIKDTSETNYVLKNNNSNNKRGGNGEESCSLNALKPINYTNSAEEYSSVNDLCFSHFLPPVNMSLTSFATNKDN